MNRIKEFIDNYRYYIIAGCGVILVVLGGLLFIQINGGYHKPETTPLANSESTGMTTTSSAITNDSTASVSNNHSSPSDGHIMVDVKGGVKSPGIYKVGTDTRISELVDLAGGFSKNADHQNVNLAQRLTDQQVVYVPLKGEIKGNVHLANSQSQSVGTNQDQASSSNSGSSDGKININTADKEKLQTISGIGEKKAENIINYRQQKGAFKSIEDIKNTDGIGDKMFENMKNSITV